MSINRTEGLQISRRYATAAFALAQQENKAAVVVEQLNHLAAAIATNKNLRDALSSPLVAHHEKAAVLAGLLKTADGLTQRTVATIAAGGRAELIPTIAGLLHDMLAAEQGEVEATITSASALAPATQKQLAASLAKATGKKVQLKLENDPAVLGGVRIELGSLRLDATLSGALSNMRAQLLATTA